MLNNNLQTIFNEIKRNSDIIANMINSLNGIFNRLVL